MVTQTPELKEEIILEYKARMGEIAEEERPNHTLAVVADLASEYGLSVNGVRMLLMKANVYIKKSEKPKSAPSDKPKRMSKEGAHTALKDAIEAGGAEADMEIITKLSGVAAQYLAATIITIISKD